MRRAASSPPTWPCTGRGLPARPVTRRAVRSYRTIAPLPASPPAVCFCGPVLGVAPTGRYPAPCPMVPGLSSTGDPPYDAGPAAVARPAPVTSYHARQPSSTCAAGGCRPHTGPPSASRLRCGERNPRPSRAAFAWTIRAFRGDVAAMPMPMVAPQSAHPVSAGAQPSKTVRSHRSPSPVARWKRVVDRQWKDIGPVLDLHR
jgi:hypothetical protein